MIRTFRIAGHLVRVPAAWTAFRFRSLTYLRRTALRTGVEVVYWVSSSGQEYYEARREGAWWLAPRPTTTSRA